MKKISIYCVNYNSYEYLAAFIKSVDAAASKVGGEAVVTVFVADNTEDNIRPIDANENVATVKVFAYNKNLGYFGAVKRMMCEAPPVDSDFVIISNVDVVMDEDVLVKLCGLRLRDDVGWIAPQIYSTSENRDRNPKIVNRYSLRKLRLLRLLFKYPLLNMLYKATLYKRKKLQTHVAGEIYGGHGSFIILTKEYYKRCGCIDYPVFLFGEEIYLAEQCLRSKLKVVYEPEVRIVDSDHASTGKMPSRFYCKCNAEALGYIIRTFY